MDGADGVDDETDSILMCIYIYMELKESTWDSFGLMKFKIPIKEIPATRMDNRRMLVYHVVVASLSICLCTTRRSRLAD